MITSTSALMPGLSPSSLGNSIIVSYFTTLPVHQPAGRVTLATLVTFASNVRSGSVTIAFMPSLTRSMIDSWMPTLTCIWSRSGMSSSTWSLRTFAPSVMSGVRFHAAAEG